jgi:hypothetical protein
MKNLFILKKNLPTNHLILLAILFAKFILPILLFGSIVIMAHDNLEISVPHEYILSKIYRGEFKYLDYFLAGNFKWFFFQDILYPINLLTLFLDIKTFFFLKNILNVCIAYFAFYNLCKKLTFSKIASTLGAAFYLTIIGTTFLVGFDLAFLPYLLYLVIKNKELKIKNYLIIIFFGLNGGLAHNFMAAFTLIPLSFCLVNKINLNNLFKILLTYLVSLLITDLPMFGIFFAGFETHRSEMLIKPNFFENLKQSATIPFFEFTINGYYSAMRVFLMVAMLVSIPLTIFQKNSRGKLLILFVITIVFFRSIFGSGFFYEIFTGFLTPLKGLNFMRIDKIIPIAMSLILLQSLKNCKKKYFKFLYIFLICGGIFLQQISPSLTYFLYDAENNIISTKKNAFIKSKNEKNIIQFVKIIFSKESYVNSRTNTLGAKFFWDNYYHFEEYKFIKKIVGEKRVMSVGLDPLVAVMNDIKVIDGYHVLYGLNYKKKFRKIIENEIKINPWLVDYYDNWGNRVYAFYNDKKNILINFKEAKNLGADYVISGFKINNTNLELLKIFYKNDIYIHDTSWMCYLCIKSDAIYLYKIN